MSNALNFPTVMREVEPGDQTGEYYILFSNLAFHSTWIELKDWLSTSCTVYYVEVFPISSCGWVCLQGTENFEAALALMQSEPFKGRSLIVDARNRNERVTIRMREYGPRGHSPLHSHNSAEAETYTLRAIAMGVLLGLILSNFDDFTGQYSTQPMSPYAWLNPYSTWDGDYYTNMDTPDLALYNGGLTMQYTYDEEEEDSTDGDDDSDDDSDDDNNYDLVG